MRTSVDDLVGVLTINIAILVVDNFVKTAQTDGEIFDYVTLFDRLLGGRLKGGRDAMNGLGSGSQDGGK